VAALSAWGFYQLPHIVSKLSTRVPANASLAERIVAQGTLYRQSFAQMYGGIFTVTAVVCVVGAVFGLMISSRRTHAEEPELHEEQPVGPRA
jgi:hypothetical protein